MDESRRALVLGTGGMTGLAWELGVLAGLAREGVDLRAHLVVGTSAGALLAARLAGGDSMEELRQALGAPIAALGRISAGTVSRLLVAQVWPSRRHAVLALGRRAARQWTPEASRRWVDTVAAGLAGRPWPPELVVVATRVASGRPAFFTARHSVDLAAAVAASCALPGVFPAVRIDGELFFDGGLRSPANLDLAGATGRVLAVAPLPASARAHRRPAVQAAELERRGIPVVLITPDSAGRRAIGIDVLASGRAEAAFRAGREAGVRRAADVHERWAG